MAKQTAYNRTLQAWVKEWSETNLDASVRKLINLAAHDLYWGPIQANDRPERDADGNEDDTAGYPGFIKACNAIADALASVPRVLYLDTDCEHWSETEPNPTEECLDCEGTGEAPRSLEAIGDADECSACGGAGHVDACLEGWWKVERRELVAAIVGKELAKYL